MTDADPDVDTTDAVVDTVAGGGKDYGAGDTGRVSDNGDAGEDASFSVDDDED